MDRTASAGRVNGDRKIHKCTERIMGRKQLEVLDRKLTATFSRFDTCEIRQEKTYDNVNFLPTRTTAIFCLDLV